MISKAPRGISDGSERIYFAVLSISEAFGIISDAPKANYQ